MSWILDYISATDFRGEIALPSQSTERWETEIEQYGVEMLIDLLGIELYDLFVAGIADDDDLYLKLRDGETYEYENTKVKYEGLKPMLLYYIYSRIILQDYSSTFAGLVKQNTDNSEKAQDFTVTKLSMDMHNKAIAKYHNARNYMYSKLSDFPTWLFSAKKIKTLY